MRRERRGGGERGRRACRPLGILEFFYSLISKEKWRYLQFAVDWFHVSCRVVIISFDVALTVEDVGAIHFDIDHC